MSAFSQRNGHVKFPDQMIPESMTQELRNSLWNFHDKRFQNEHDQVTVILWTYHYKEILRSRPVAYQKRKMKSGESRQRRCASVSS